MQALGGGRAVVALGLEAGVARGAAEQLEKGTCDAPVRQGDRALVLRDKGEGLRDGAGVVLRARGDLVEGVD